MNDFERIENTVKELHAAGYSVSQIATKLAAIVDDMVNRTVIKGLIFTAIACAASFLAGYIIRK